MSTTLKKVLSELNPQGLKRLELKPQDESEEYEFIAEASPPKVLFKKKFWGRYRKPKVRMVATLTLSGEQDVTEGLESPTKFVQDTISYSGAKITKTRREKIVEKISYGTIGGVAGQSVSGGVLVKSETASKSNQIQVVSWSTGDPKPGNNPSHAERQFMDWFDSQPGPWKERVQQVSLYINYSPCPHCVSDLCTWVAIHSIKVNLRWDNKFYATQASDFAKLKKCLWKTSGPEK
jgi:hypothetical protein